MTPKINILICDDHAILLEGLKVCLLHMPEVDKIAVSSTLHDATQLLESEQHFDYTFSCKRGLYSSEKTKASKCFIRLPSS